VTLGQRLSFAIVLVVALGLGVYSYFVFVPGQPRVLSNCAALPPHRCVSPSP